MGHYETPRLKARTRIISKWVSAHRAFRFGFKRLQATFFFLSLVLAGTAILVSGCDSARPTDDELALQLKSQRAVFETIREQHVAIPQVAEITLTSSSVLYGRAAPDRISYDRALEKYRLLLREVKADAVFWEDGGTWLEYYVQWKLGPDSLIKGVVYLPRPPKALVASTDAGPGRLRFVQDTPKPKQFAVDIPDYVFRRIEGNWYVYYNSE